MNEMITVSPGNIAAQRVILNDYKQPHEGPFYKVAS